MRDRAVSAKIEVPPVVVRIQVHVGDALLEFFEVLFAFGTTDYLAQSGTSMSMARTVFP